MATVNIDSLKKKILDRLFSGLKPAFNQGKYYYYLNGFSRQICRTRGFGTTEVLCGISDDDLIPYITCQKEEKANENCWKAKS